VLDRLLNYERYAEEDKQVSTIRRRSMVKARSGAETVEMGVGTPC
jgi:hypothetical protein